MTTRRPPLRHSLAATAAAVCALMLSACGGGNGVAPPVGGGNVVASAAPVATITNNVSAETATGPIIFMISFDRDVGTSFTNEDVTVTGGTKGAFTRLSGTAATLLVNPMAGSVGTVQITVLAGSVTDATGQANAVASASKAYDTTVVAPPPPPPAGSVVLANFDDVNPPVFGFEGADGSSIEAGPAGGGSGNSFKLLRSGGTTFALGIIETAIPITATARTLSAQVFSPLAGIPMVLKIEGPGGADSGETQANETVVVGWQTLTWTFSGADPARTYNKIVLLPNLGTVDAPPGQAYFFDNLLLLGAAGGGGGGSSGALTFSSGFAGGGRTIEGGEFGGFSGSNLDNFGCDGNPANCGSGGDIAPAVPAADSFFFYYYQTPTPAAGLYMGIYVQAPGVTGGFQATSDTPGVQVSNQTTLRFKLGQNAEWFGTATNNFMIVMDLGRRYTVGGDPACRLQLRRVVTPTAAAASDYSIPLSSFSLVQDCGGAVSTVAQALAASPISQIAFQGVGGTIAVSDGTRTSGANLSAANGAGVYPTTLVLQGGITID